MVDDSLTEVVVGSVVVTKSILESEELLVLKI